MTLSQARHTTIQDDDGREQLPALLQRGKDNTYRLSQHVCLLERRLRGGGEPTGLLLLVQDIKFAVEELHTLLQSAEQAVARARTSAVRTADGRERRAPAQRQRAELGPLLTHCVATARQRLYGNSAPVRCHIPSDLPVVTADPETVAHIFSLLFEHALRASGREEREVRVQWTKETLVVDIDDAGRGIAQETYARMRQLVEQMDGTLRVSHELGQRSRVELTFLPVPASGSAARQVVSLHPKGHGH
jgi:signal transduction histidine kinase